MRVTFVAIGWEQLGISLLSAIAKEKGHEVNLAFSVSLFNDRCHLNIPRLSPFFDDRKNVIEMIRKQKPDVLAFSALTPNYQWMVGIAQEAKMLFPHVKIIFGGVHTSAVPDLVLSRSCVDYVCIGEGDIAFPAILDAIESGQTLEPIPNTRFKLPGGEIVRGHQAGFIQDLDSLPMYDKTLWEDYMQFDETYITMASRGCPYRCTFCFNNFFANLPEKRTGRYVRQRSVEHMMSELRWAKKRYRLHMIEFFDDIFTVDKKWLKVFLDQYKTEIRVPFQCFTHVKFVDEDVARWLSEAGCFSGQIGIQSMDDEFKRQTTKRYETTGQIERTLRWMNKYRIKPKFDHLFGLPGESLEAQETARKFYASAPPYNIQTYWVKYFPGTRLVQQGLEAGLITFSDVNRINDGMDCDVYSHSNKYIDPEKIKAYQAYQLVFKLIPVLPAFFRKRLHAKLFEQLPGSVCSMISFLADIFIGLIRASPDHILYAKYYLYHMGRFLLAKIGIRVPPATRPLNLQNVRSPVFKNLVADEKVLITR
ncbi:cobalamin B12-binding domain-containing protein [Candidatus Peregrinibacteria bacterium]|nr:cobalamin B12-binding domain-containing protein [Candidatus Peregrinibacteria bacterium]